MLSLWLVCTFVVCPFVVWGVHGQYEWILDARFDNEPIFFLNHTISGTPTNCCDECETQVPTAEVVACVSKYAGRRDCECRLDYELMTNKFYMCDDTWEDMWRWDGNSFLTNGPFDEIEVDFLKFSLVQPWTSFETMLWPYVWRVDEEDPCGKPFEDRALTLIDSRFDMTQFSYILTFNSTVTLPRAWTFTAEVPADADCYFLFKDLTTHGHMIRGLNPTPSPTVTPFDFNHTHTAPQEDQETVSNAGHTTPVSTAAPSDEPRLRALQLTQGAPNTSVGATTRETASLLVFTGLLCFFGN
ncbi:putative transmembrane protein [Gregarina niphandrodes]|uniref:Transmembrane protein n=1 Tax=Gregarina niphandrodes TaxID=110365 RepID=A0A023BBD8_GRENI|nr:putative transmembrane protein [Gregarina niphandrodes]EZG79120.1 putative transmembrane protein [Gregarina niphandrodes]|eukprot:XP_011129128.1 putative transmembrane protein [Gregarina niphandrodes]